MEKGNTALLTVIGVATLLVALVGATFAYFTATLSNESAQSISVTTATPVGLEYEGSSLLLPNAMPGDSAGLDEDDEIMIINTEGIIIRMECSGISVLGRITSGVKLINLQENTKVASIAKVRETQTDDEVETEE